MRQGVIALPHCVTAIRLFGLELSELNTYPASDYKNSNSNIVWNVVY